jgi:hypothetical protein
VIVDGGRDHANAERIEVEREWPPSAHHGPIDRVLL